MADVSVNNIKMRLTIGLIPLELDYLAADGTILSIQDSNTGGATLTPDGKIVTWGKNDLINVSITLNGASKAAEAIRLALSQQRRLGAIPAIQLPITLTITRGNEKEIYTEGTATSGALGRPIGNETLENVTFNFSFAHRIMTGL